MTVIQNDDKNMERKMRPFVSIWKRMKPEFIVLVRELLYLLRKYGIEKVGEGNARKNRVEFMSAVHDGWKKCQGIISSEIILRLDEISLLKQQSKDFHIQKKSKEKMRCLNDIKIIEYEIKVLRRFIDSIIWTLLDNEHSTIRRLPLPDNNDNLSKKNILDSMVAANIINENPTSIAIISDLTTFVHAGDLVVMQIDKGLTLAEVKSGDKNIEFSHAAQFSVETKCPHFDEAYTQGFDEKDIKHYNRTKKQWERLAGITNTINDGSGYDYYHKTQVKIDDKNYIPEFYNDAIVKRWHELKSGKNWSIDVIDDCIYIGAYKETEMGFVGFNSWMDGTEFKGHVFNISDSIVYHFSQPFFNLNLPHELIEDVICEGMIIVLCLDYKKFMEFGNNKHPGLLHLARPPKNRQDPNDYFMIDNEALFSYKNGIESFVGTGMESRIIFDFQTPASVVEWIYKGSDIYTQVNRKKQKERRETQRNKKKKLKRARRSRSATRK